MNATINQTALVLRRQIKAALVDPGPSFILPVMPSILMLVVFTSVFEPISQADGYDTSAFTASGWDAFVIPGVVVLVAMLGGGYTSSSLAADLRSGYTERMSLAGVGAWPHLLGRLTFEAFRLLPGLIVVVLVGFLLGAEADNGVVGVAVLIVLISLLGVAFTGIFYLAAIKSEDPQTPFMMQPLGLPLAFLSSALVPIAIMPGWSRAIARINPVSVVVDASRNAMVGDLWSQELLAAIVVLTVWAGLSQLAAWKMLQARLRGSANREMILAASSNSIPRSWALRARAARATGSPVGSPSGRRMTVAPNSFTRQLGLVLRRTWSDGLRNFPLAFVAPTMLAAFVAVIFAAVFDAVADTPGFPAESFVEWVAPGSVLLTAFVGAGYAAGALLRDIETGYLDRLRLLPIRPPATILARASFEGIRVVLPATVVLGGSLLLGAENQNGVVGFVAVIAISVVVAVAWNGVFFMVAMWTKSQQAVLGLQPLFMPIIMFSTFFAPTSNAPGWFDAIASANPFTQLLNGTRSVLAADTNTTELLVGLGAFVAIGLVTYTVAGRAYSAVLSPD